MDFTLLEVLSLFMEYIWWSIVRQRKAHSEFFTGNLIIFYSIASHVWKLDRHFFKMTVMLETSDWNCLILLRIGQVDFASSLLDYFKSHGKSCSCFPEHLVTLVECLDDHHAENQLNYNQSSHKKILHGMSSLASRTIIPQNIYLRNSSTVCEEIVNEITLKWAFFSAVLTSSQWTLYSWLLKECNFFFWNKVDVMLEKELLTYCQSTPLKSIEMWLFN